MPVEVCTLEGAPGYRYGSSGKCYTYTSGDSASRQEARERAELQGRAARAAGYEKALTEPVAVRNGIRWLQMGVGSIAVLTQKGGPLSSSEALELLWEVQGEAADAVDQAYSRVANTAINQATSRSISTAVQADAAVRHVQEAIRAFSRSKELEDILESVVRASYGFGVLYIWNRYTEVKRRLRKPEQVPIEQTGLRRPVEKAEGDAFSEISGAVNFTLEDENAVDNVLGTAKNVWLTDDDGNKYTSAIVRERVGQKAKDLIQSGRTGRQVGSELKLEMQSLFGAGVFDKKARSYWGGVVEHVATEAGVRGQIYETYRLGFTRYELINPMDERTTPCCALLNGTTALVPDAQSLIFNVDAAKTPEEVKAVKPFVSGGKTAPILAAVPDLKAGRMDLSPAQSAALAQAGFALPPFHFLCRTYVDAFYELEDVPDPVVAPIPPAERTPGEPSPPVEP